MNPTLENLSMLESAADPPQGCTLSTRVLRLVIGTAEPFFERVVVVGGALRWWWTGAATQRLQLAGHKIAHGWMRAQNRQA